MLRHGLPISEADMPNLATEDPDENLRLALLWDSRGLLSLLPRLPDGQEKPYTADTPTRLSGTSLDHRRPFRRGIF